MLLDQHLGTIYLTLIGNRHQLRLAKDAEHIIVMENGKVVEEGAHKTLLEQEGRYWEM